MPYADASTQTLWAGLTKRDLVRPEFLLTIPDTTTPPDDMLTHKSQTVVVGNNVRCTLPRRPTLLERRGNNPDLACGISLPGALTSQLGDELTASPPPTHALLSPLPAANKLYAGHTPLIPGSPSPDHDNDLQVAGELVVEADDMNDESPTPQQDPPLSGALSLPTLPTNPVDGTEEFIVLNDLNRALEEIARDQERFGKLKDAPEPMPASASPRKSGSSYSSEAVTDDGLSLSRKGSADSRSSNVSYVNGVPLKSPPLNFGVPMGQLQKE